MYIFISLTQIFSFLWSLQQSEYRIFMPLQFHAHLQLISSFAFTVVWYFLGSWFCLFFLTISLPLKILSSLKSGVGLVQWGIVFLSCSLFILLMYFIKCHCVGHCVLRTRAPPDEELQVSWDFRIRTLKNS